ncbi:MAG: RHS repeat-associated core domain-containing protein, partial [Gammaproteobacteria bacterium]|nr:RHS repeat-associated core domain-containing protein [Gammaproteobacteria bacterium]
RLESVDGVAYSYDNNGNLLTTGSMTNTWDTANRLVESSRNNTTIQPIYNGVNDRVGQTVGLSTTHFALDSALGLPEIIYTSEAEAYLHLPGVIMTEKMGEVRYLLSDGLGSIRQAIDDTGAVVAYNEFDPYGNPIANLKSEIKNPYGFTGEWWEDDLELLHLRARWYMPETGTFLSVDPVESEPPYQYVRGNPINFVDPSGMQCPSCRPEPDATSTPAPPESTPAPEPAPEPVIVGTPTPTPIQPRPPETGLTEMINTAIRTHATGENDGFIFGGSLAVNALAAIAISAEAHIPPELKANGVC